MNVAQGLAEAIGAYRGNGSFVRTAYLGALNYAAPCLEGPVWGSRAAAIVILADRPERAERADQAIAFAQGCSDPAPQTA